MKKTYLLIAVLAILSFLIISTKKSYNLVLISIDSLRPDNVKADAQSIDKLSETSTVFKNAYTIYPNSVGSYYTLLTGNNYLVNNELSTLKFIEKFDGAKNKDYVNLTSRLKKNGYLTTAFVANQRLNKDIFKYGFDEFKGDLSNETVSKNAVEKIKNNSGKNFFLWADFKIPDAVNINEKKRLFSCIKQVYPEDMTRIPVSYSISIRKLDVAVGAVISALKEAGVDKNTVVVVYSDKGENFDQKFYGLGKTLYNSDVRSVLIIKDPLQKSSQTVSKAIDNSKISDLILNRLENSKTMKKIDEFVNSGLTFFRISYGRNLKVGVSDNEFKFIYNLTTDGCLPERDASEFYDLVKDPGEKKNLISDPTKQRKIAEMKEALSKQTMVPIKNPGEKIDVIDRLKSLGY